MTHGDFVVLMVNGGPVVPSPKLLAAVDHIEMEHEREVPSGSLDELRATHAEMHRNGYHWNHNPHSL